MPATVVHPQDGEDYSHVPTERAAGPEWVLAFSSARCGPQHATPATRHRRRRGRDQCRQVLVLPPPDCCGRGRRNLGPTDPLPLDLGRGEPPAGSRCAARCAPSPPWLPFRPTARCAPRCPMLRAPAAPEGGVAAGPRPRRFERDALADRVLVRLLPDADFLRGLGGSAQVRGSLDAVSFQPARREPPDGGAVVARVRRACSR